MVQRDELTTPYSRSQIVFPSLTCPMSLLPIADVKDGPVRTTVPTKQRIDLIVSSEERPKKPPSGLRKDGLRVLDSRLSASLGEGNV